MNRLFYNRVYLSGPIDNAKDFGTGWRNDVKKMLADLHLIFLDPCAKPMQAGYACEDLENHQRRLEQKKQGDFETISREMRLIRCIDLRLADLCDFAIVHLDKNVYSTGTHEEIALLNRRKVPILVHMEQGKAALPDWYWGTLPHQHVFSTWDELIAYVWHVAADPPPIDSYNRWRFIDYGLLYELNQIPLTKGKTAKISPEDHAYLSKWHWCAVPEERYKWRAMRKTGAGTTRYMHQDIAERLGWHNVYLLEVDHINGDSLDNQRDNLRVATRSQNCHNKGAQINSRTGVKGISYVKQVRKYAAEIMVKGKRHRLGHFRALADAKKALNEAGKRLVGPHYKEIL